MILHSNCSLITLQYTGLVGILSLSTTIGLRLPDDRMEGIWYDCDTDEEGDEKNDACWEDLLDVLKDNIALLKCDPKTNPTRL